MLYNDGRHFIDAELLGHRQAAITIHDHTAGRDDDGALLGAPNALGTSGLGCNLGFHLITTLPVSGRSTGLDHGA